VQRASKKAALGPGGPFKEALGSFQVAVCAKVLAPIEVDVAVVRAPTSELTLMSGCRRRA